MISTKGRYALRTMIDIAEHPNGPVTLKDVAERQEISKKYLEIICKMLVEGGLLVGLPGKYGGYRLAKAPEDYSIYEILRVTEGNLATVSCLDPDKPYDCPRKDFCRTLPLWEEYDRLVHDFFKSKKLSDYMENDGDWTQWSI